MLRNFDKEGNGFILAVEMRRILTSIGDRLTEEEAEQILEGLEDSQGNINYEGKRTVRTSLQCYPTNRWGLIIRCR